MLAMYPGSFDPLHNGHLDVIERASRIFDTVMVCVFANQGKLPIFSQQERVDMVRQSVKAWPNVVVEEGSGLLVDFAHAKHAGVIIRGLRAVLDFDYEFQFSLMNRKMAPDVETVFLLTSEAHMYLSSTLIKELASYQADISELVPAVVDKRLQQYYGEK